MVQFCSYLLINLFFEEAQSQNENEPSSQKLNTAKKPDHHTDISCLDEQNPSCDVQNTISCVDRTNYLIIWSIISTIICFFSEYLHLFILKKQKIIIHLEWLMKLNNMHSKQ